MKKNKRRRQKDHVNHSYSKDEDSFTEDDLDEELLDDEDEDEDDLDVDSDEDDDDLDVDSDGDEDDEDDSDGDEDDEDEDSEEGDSDDPPAVYYKVERAATDGDGNQRKPGDVVEVKCKNCALYKRKWAGKVHCDEGSPVGDGAECRPDIFSCEAFFWPFDRKGLLEQYLDLGPAEILLIGRMVKGARRLFGAPVPKKGGWVGHLDWLLETGSKMGLEDFDAQGSWDLAFKFLTDFDSFDQINFSFDFFETYSRKLKKNLARKTRKDGKAFVKGDMVEWTNRADGSRIKGLVFPLAGKGTKGNIRLVVTEASDEELKGMKMDYPYKEWLESCKPKILVKAKS